LNVPGRKNPQCRLTYADKYHQVIAVKIENFGAIIASTVYSISLDDIVLPSLSSSDRNQKFDISLEYIDHTLNQKFSYKFPEIFQIDGSTQTSPVTNHAYSFTNPTIRGYGLGITG